MSRTSPDPELADALIEYGRYMTYAQAAEYTGTSERTLKRMTQRGELPLYRIGRTRSYRMKTTDVHGLIVQVA